MGRSEGDEVGTVFFSDAEGTNVRVVGDPEGDPNGTTLGPPVGMEDSEGNTLGTCDGVALGIQDGPVVG